MRLVIDGVSKQYAGKVWGLRDLRLELGPGVVGLLGPNGAGKSTLMRIIATVTRASEGRVLWNDADIARSPDTLRSVLGYLPQDFGVYPHLTALEERHIRIDLSDPVRVQHFDCPEESMARRPPMREAEAGPTSDEKQTSLGVARLGPRRCTRLKLFPWRMR